ncbi:MAG: sulfate adenylyltransferase [Bacillota bacterium]
MIAPHGGKLVDRMAHESERGAWYERSKDFPKVCLDQDQLMELENIAVGLYSPLDGFMDERTYRSVLEDMRLPNGLPWSLPVILGVGGEQAGKLARCDMVTLADHRGISHAVLKLAEIYKPDKRMEARGVYLTEDEAHPGVSALYARGEYLLAGEVLMFRRILYGDFQGYRLDPCDIRRIIFEKGWNTVTGFQTRNPIHRAHEYIQKCALEITDGLLINPLVGRTKAGDIPAELRMESYEALIESYYPAGRILLAVFPAPMRYAGPREAVFHAVCRKNYGCTHFVVGRDHAGVGGYYGPYDAQRIFGCFSKEELGIQPLFFEHTFYCYKCGNMASPKTCPHGAEDRLNLSGTKVREMLNKGIELPAEFTRPEVARVLKKGCRRR